MTHSRSPVTVFVFRGRRGDLLEVLRWNGDGLCLFAKRLEQGRFVWPQAGATLLLVVAACARAIPAVREVLISPAEALRSGFSGIVCGL